MSGVVELNGKILKGGSFFSVGEKKKREDGLDVAMKPEKSNTVRYRAEKNKNKTAPA